jgi:3-methylcrotonyl-CoA carboxylase alpha subunit
MTDNKIRTLLVANRGEIALRIMGTAHNLGIRCIAVHSEADRNAPFVHAADQAFEIGPAAASESYLRVDKILEAARQAGADAIHPGYGFLSENTQLAEACEQSGMHFIGPPAYAIAAMGSKSAAKALMEKAGVPLVPGYHGDDQSAEQFRKAAGDIGYPLLIKASAGGGGKGMRVVRAAGELEDAIAAAQREAQASFGDPHLLLERYLETPRHVEVQVLFDRHGKGVYLFDRDCSVQRRHQKIIEEAPAPGIPDEVRKAMGEAAVRCGEAIDYVGAGTVEFLYEPGGHFYFMEMNTRLQVEHPVTECITGLDLVEWQIRIAENHALPWQQPDLGHSGHAMEARIYAEDPDNDFLPMTGTLHHLAEPSGLEGIRVDSGVGQGQEITPWYDPMLAKVIAFGDTRDQARQRLIKALHHYRAMGVTLNTAFVCRVLDHPDFAKGELTTHFIDKHQDTLFRPDFTEQEKQHMSWLAWYRANRPESNLSGPWDIPDSYRLGGSARQHCELRINEQDSVLWYTLQDDDRALLWSDTTHDPVPVRWKATDDGDIRVTLPDRMVTLAWAAHGERLGVFADACHWEALVNHPEEQQAQSESDGALKAPMHGRVTSVTCKAGERVTAGTVLAALEAMKMEHSLKAPTDGTVTAVHCAEGDNVASGDLLIELETE